MVRTDSLLGKWHYCETVVLDLSRSRRDETSGSMGIWSCLYFILGHWGSRILNSSVLSVAMITMVGEIRRREKGSPAGSCCNSEARHKERNGWDDGQGMGLRGIL